MKKHWETAPCLAFFADLRVWCFNQISVISRTSFNDFYVKLDSVFLQCHFFETENVAKDASGKHILARFSSVIEIPS